MTGVLAALAASGARIVSIPAIAESSAGAGGQTCNVVFGRDGSIRNESGTLLAYWVTSYHSTVGDQYYVKGTKTGGTSLTTAPTDATYVQLNTDRTFELVDLIVGTALTWTGDFAIARDSGGTGAVTRTGCTIQANRTS